VRVARSILVVAALARLLVGRPALAQAIAPPRVVTESPAEAPSGAGERDVDVVVTIDKSGAVVDAQVANPADAVERAARDAATRYRFAPATKDGAPIVAKVTLRIHVTTASPPAPAPPPPPAPAPAPPPPPATATAPVQDITVAGTRPQHSITVRSLDRRDLESMPGTGGDALRVVESLPGVARAPAFSGLIIVRGSAPQDTQIFMDGTSVPLAFHFGGLAAIVPTELLARLDVYPGNFDVAFGRGLGGIIDLGLRSPARDRLHASARVDLLDGRALVESPIDDKTRVLVAARRSWFDAWFPSVARASGLGVTAAPVYYDYQAVIERDLPRGAVLRATLVGSDDRLAFTLPPDASDPAFNGTLFNKTTFWRSQLRAEGPIGDARWTATGSFGHDTLSLSLGNFRATDDVWRANARAEIDAKISRALRLRGGLDVEAGWYDFDLIFPPVPTPDEPDIGPIFGRPPLHQTRSSHYFDPAAYVSAEIKPTWRWRVLAGVRADLFSPDVPGIAVQPRASVRYTLVDRPRKTLFKAALGLFAQQPQPFENDPVFGTPNIAYEQAVHTSVGIEQELSRNVELSLEPFHKHLFDLVSRRIDPNAPSGFRYTNEGSGFVYGAELLLKYKPDARFLGWIAYTISRSERRALPEQDNRIFEYDQTHVLAALGSLRLGRGWEIGARFRYVTGNPYTPIRGGAFDADAGAYAAVEQRPLYSARVPAFYSLDVRVEKRWRLSEHANVSVYLDVLNATNRRNVEGITGNFDYSRTTVVAGLPILPVVGVRGEL